MANLIPPDAKRAIVIEYWIRVATVWFALIGFGLIVIAVLKLPTFILVQTQLRSLGDDYENALVKEEAFAEAQKVIGEANDLSRILNSHPEIHTLSGVIDILDEIAGTEVSIFSFEFEKEEATISKISVSGKANTRTSLSNFSKDIEAHELFSDAELPISNLAKDKDISFNIEIVPEAN